MKNREENVEFFFRAVEEVKNTSGELYDKYIGDKLQVHKEENKWTVSYLDNQITASEEEGVYPFVPIISTAMLDCLSGIREDTKKAAAETNLQPQIRLRNAIIQFVTNEFVTKKYAEKRKRRQPVKKMVEMVWQFQGKMRACLQTDAARRIVECLSIKEKDNIYDFELYNKPFGGRYLFYTGTTEKQTKAELFCLVAYTYEMKRRLEKQKARRKNEQFQEDAWYLLTEIQKLEKVYIQPTVVGKK